MGRSFYINDLRCFSLLTIGLFHRKHCRILLIIPGHFWMKSCAYFRGSILYSSWNPILIFKSWKWPRVNGVIWDTGKFGTSRGNLGHNYNPIQLYMKIEWEMCLNSIWANSIYCSYWVQLNVSPAIILFIRLLLLAYKLKFYMWGPMICRL